MKKTQNGHTLVETLIGTALLGLVLSTIVGVQSMMARATRQESAHREDRQAARLMLRTIVGDVQQSVFVYSGSFNLGGHAFTCSGQDLVFAVPEVPASGYISEGHLTYTLGALYSEPLQPPDPNNPDAQEVVYLRYPDVTPTVADIPASIDMTTVTATWPNVTRRLFQPYLVSGTWISSLSPEPGVALDIHTRRTVAGGSTATEHLATQTCLRNSN